ncbi:S-layer domain protein [Paenibacillus sabinae T27]|uniref:S-layer domain protein n=2 Tax=Paenibacillus sabinae TaxID=365617 RepID=X4Z7Y6_9BACL|nr:S-layer homology domain-containing protein [Paenibacillus sabinae]AHV95811.1 S-layer domain protein [Paenibacillus sabinae T27]
MFFAVQVLSFSGPSYAENQTSLNDISRHWAEEEIKVWIGNGLISGYADRTFQPDKVITRAEFISLANKAFGFSHKADQTFKDVPQGKWFYNDVSKAKFTGYISGFGDGTFRPDQPITREESAKIIYQLMQLEEGTITRDTEAFQDEQQMSAWSKPYIKVVASKGYLKGYPDKSFRPQKPITRAEAVVVLDQAVGQLIHQPGTYDLKNTVGGNLTINSGGVTLKNAVIKGDLILAAGIGEGEVLLDHVTVEGRTIVNGGGEHSIVIQDSSMNQVVVQKDLGRVRLFTKGDTSISSTVVKSGAKLEEEQGNEAFKSVSVESTSVNDLVQFEGTFAKVAVKTTVTIEIYDQSTIALLETYTGSEGAAIKLQDNAVLKEIILQAAAKITGEGTILKAEINAEGVSFEQIIKEYILSETVKVVVIGGKEVGSSSPVPTVPSPGEVSNPTGPVSPAPTPAPASPAPESPAPGQLPVEQPAPEPGKVLDIKAAFIVQDKLYTLYPATYDYSAVKWNVANSVTQDTYQTEYDKTVQDVGVYSISGGALPPASYDVTNPNSSQHFSGVMLSSVTVNDSVYAKVYYSGTETISYQINDSYTVHDLDNQMPAQAVPLADGDTLAMVYGDQFEVFATWNGSGWELDAINDQLEAPTHLMASTVSNKAIALQWDPVANADQYHIYYSATPTGEFVSLKDPNGQPVTVTGTTYVDSSNLPHTTRYYVVTAAKAGIGMESGPSNVTFATTYYNAHISLDFQITDTIRHPSEPILYITDKSSKKLYRINYETGTKDSISFSFAPESLTYADGKIYVSLLKAEHSSYTDIAQQQGAIAVVDAATFTLEGTHNIAIDPFDIAADRSGHLYVASGSGQWTEIKSYDLNTFAEIASSGIRQASYIQMHPVWNKLYTITTDSSPRDLSAYNVTNGQYVEPSYPGGYDSPYHGEYNMAPNFTISPDGAYIFNGVGSVFMATNKMYDDMKYVYGLGQTYADIAFDLPSHKFYTVKNNAVQVYDYSNFKQSGLYHLDGTAKYVFNDTDKLLTISAFAGKNVIEIVEKNTFEAAPPAPVSGIQLDGRVADIAYDPANQKAYAIDEAFNNLYVVDLQTQTVANTVKLPYRPAGLTLSEDGSSLFIVNDDLNQLVTEVRLSDLKVVRHLPYTSVKDSGDFSDRHIYHKSGLLYIVMGNWEPTLLVFNSATFASVNYGTGYRSWRTGFLRR